MFVINPDPYLLPSYRISPFSTSDVAFNNNLPDNDLIDNYFNKRFEGNKFHYTVNGRSALTIALSHYNLAKEDIITVYTTSGNNYISKCVTDVISYFCGWSTKIQNNTKVILVNHEFGYPYKGLRELKTKGLPIIEDCAHSFFSYDNDHSTGQVGDFVIYSFPKMFPMQLGGLLFSASNINHNYTGQLQPGMLRYIKNVLSEYIQVKDQIMRDRLSNYMELRSRFETLGLSERFNLENGVVPGVFMFRTDSQNLDLNDLKKHFWAHGIQSSVFYGEEAFFIPVHQALTQYDLDYFYEVMKVFLQKADK